MIVSTTSKSIVLLNTPKNKIQEVEAHLNKIIKNSEQAVSTIAYFLSIDSLLLTFLTFNFGLLNSSSYMLSGWKILLHPLLNDVTIKVVQNWVAL